MEITLCFVRFQWSRIAPFNPVRFLIDDSRRGNRSIGEHRQVRQAGSYLLSLWIEAICTQPASSPFTDSPLACLVTHGYGIPAAVESISYPIESQSSKWTSKGQYWNESLRNLSRRCTEDGACWNWGERRRDNISKSAYAGCSSRRFLAPIELRDKMYFCISLNIANRCCWIFVSMGLVEEPGLRSVAQCPRTKNTFLIAYRMQVVVEFAGSSGFDRCKNFLRRNCSIWLQVFASI